jgi:ABC-2 type transport system ATP-binding protein
MIKATGLARTFKTRKGDVEAVKGVDLAVHSGEIVGFLGPNGAGKTTTLRMLTTLLDPTAGTATVAGCDLRTDPLGVRRRIGYVAQSGSTQPEARVGEEIVDHASMYGLDRATARRRGEELCDRLDLVGLWDRLTGKLSGGQRRRLDVVMGLVHDPVVVFLDEPSTGLDPQSRANLWEHVRALRDEHGLTVFLTTHYLDEADALCDRIMVIDHGRIVAEGTPGELKRQVSGEAITLTLGDAASAGDALEIARTALGDFEVVADGRTLRLNLVDGGAALPRLLRAMDDKAVDIVDVDLRHPTLDDVFLALTGRSLRDDAA